MFSKLFTFG